MQKQNAIDDTRFLTEKQVASIIGRSAGTLRSDRFKRVGIPYHKLGRSVRYLWKDVKEFMATTRIETDDFE